MTEPTVDSRLADLERRVSLLEGRGAGGPGGVADPTPGTPKPKSAREFLNEKGATSAVDKALVLAVWLERSGVANITTENISGGFEAAKEPLSGNPSDLLYQNGRRSFIAPTREKKGAAKTWYVTTAGERFVENGLKDQ